MNAAVIVMSFILQVWGILAYNSTQIDSSVMNVWYMNKASLSDECVWNELCLISVFIIF